jgi:hypothetical protein
MLSTVADQVRPIPDLAASLTELTLEVLAGVGGRGVSIGTELELWHALTDRLDHELHRRSGQGSAA